MEVELNFQAGTAGPLDGLVEVGELTLDVRILVTRSESPVADRDADVCQTCTGNRAEVGRGDPGAPVGVEVARCLLLAEGLCVGVLVDDAAALREERGSDPWLEDEPAAKIDATDLVVAIALTGFKRAVCVLVMYNQWQGVMIMTYDGKGVACTVLMRAMATVRSF